MTRARMGAPVTQRRSRPRSKPAPSTPGEPVLKPNRTTRFPAVEGTLRRARDYRNAESLVIRKPAPACLALLPVGRMGLQDYSVRGAPRLAENRWNRPYPRYCCGLPLWVCSTSYCWASPSGPTSAMPRVNSVKGTRTTGKRTDKYVLCTYRRYSPHRGGFSTYFLKIARATYGIRRWLDEGVQKVFNHRLARRDSAGQSGRVTGIG